MKPTIKLSLFWFLLALIVKFVPKEAIKTRKWLSEVPKEKLCL
jgi:hypothetical protein